MGVVLNLIQIIEVKLPERFEKTYISVQEFINSWEKEVYELTNLDYFTFLLINQLGNKIETEYFKIKNRNPYLKIDPDEIGTLAFNIGDSFESFLENNCFGDCNLSCPTQLDEPIDPQNDQLGENHLHILQLMNGSDWNKKQFLLTDILNYVVLDTLFDFYNYEIGLELDDTDIGLLEFADFITDILEKFIEFRGKPFLLSPKDSATEVFDKLISESHLNWEDSLNNFEDDEQDEADFWKQGNMGIEAIIEDYCFNLLAGEKNNVTEQLLTYFQKYASDYAGIKRIDEFSYEDIEEFFAFWLPREIALEWRISSEMVDNIFSKFLTWLELKHESELKNYYNRFRKKNFAAFDAALKATKKYLENNSVIDGFLEANDSDGGVVDGFFEIIKVQQNGLLRLKDIHFTKQFINVQIKNNAEFKVQSSKLNS